MYTEIYRKKGKSMKKRFFVAALAAVMFATTAFGLAACSKDPATSGVPGTGGGGGGGGVPDTGHPLTITLNANGGSFGGSTTKTATTSDTGRLLSEPAKPAVAPADMTFYGWGISSTSTKKITFPHKFDEDCTIYAIWKDDENIGGTEYTITFNPQGGTFVDDPTASTLDLRTIDGKISNARLPMLATRDGYDFAGWYTQVNGGGTQVALKTFDSSVTVYAHWTQGEVIGGDNGSRVETVGGDQDKQGHPNVYLVGKFGDMTSVSKDTGYFVEYSGQGQYDDATEFTITITLAVGDEVAFFVPKWENFLCSTIEDGCDVTGYLTLVKHGEDGYLRVDKAGQYTFNFKSLWGSDRIYVHKP